MHPMVLVGDEAQAKACFGPFKIVLILVQDRCTVCTEHTIGSEIVLHTPDETPRLCVSGRIFFHSVWRY
jgi:hypothetical protein